MKTWKKVYAAAEFVCAATETVAVGATSNIAPGGCLSSLLHFSIFATYAGIDALKED